MMKPSPCPVCGFVRRPARGLPLGDCGGMRSPCSASRRRSNSTRCSSRAELREPLRYNEEGLGRRTVAPEPLVGLARPVHVDQLRRRTLQTTTSLVTRRLKPFAALGRYLQGGLPGIEANTAVRFTRSQRSLSTFVRHVSQEIAEAPPVGRRAC